MADRTESYHTSPLGRCEMTSYFVVPPTVPHWITTRLPVTVEAMFGGLIPGAPVYWQLLAVVNVTSSP